MTLVLACLLILCVLAFTALLVRAVVLRRRLVRGGDVFPCTVRILRGATPRLSSRSPGRSCHAEWKHDVLLLHRGFGFTWAHPLAVRIAQNVISPAGQTEQGRLGPGAVELHLRLDDDAVIAVAAPAWAREKLAGPFLAIAVQGLPPGISERRR